MKLSLFIILIALMCSACDKEASKHNFKDPTTHTASNTADNLPAQDPHDLSTLLDELDAEGMGDDTPEINPIYTTDGKIQIDWTHLHTGVERANLADYAYPIALDSLAVKNYATAYHISDIEAQHSIVVGMASPEALGKILDQLQNAEYLSHQLTDGADMSLVIYTTDKVVADKFDYVFEEKFARGLVLPIIIEPKPPKSSPKP